jgi:hypothetical protein
MLTYVEDADGDGVLDREEYLLGTDRAAVGSAAAGPASACPGAGG